jgi:hypothetical protein
MTISITRRPARLFAIVAVAIAFGGCGSEDEIRSYSVAKEKKEAAPVAASTSSEATDRMLGAILPAGQQTWYFKTVGPIAAVDERADEILKFFETIRFNAGSAKPEWQTPEGWQEQAGSGMRAATILIPADPKPLEMSVIALPSSGTPNELLDNVNRWRGQLQLPEINEHGLAAGVNQLQVGENTMSLIDLRGQFSAGSMTAPFAGGGPFSGGAGPATPPFAGKAGQGDAPQAPGAAPFGKLPPGHPTVDGGDAVDQAMDAPFTFEKPEGWQQQPAAGMRKAVFAVTDGGNSATVTAIDLSAAAPNVADPLANLNRWRGEIGLEPIKREELESKVHKIEVSGSPSDYLEAIPDASVAAESRAKEATIAAIVPSGGNVWFFKLRGDRDLVVAQQENFKSFLESVRFKPADGAGDGNQ